MDPLLSNLTDESFRSLVQEQRPGWAVPAREEAPAPAPRPSMWENIKQSGMDTVKGLNRGFTSDLVGAPVDIINVLLKAMDDTKMLPQRFSTQKPVGGSEWINEQLVKAGLAPAVSNSPSEAGGRLLGGFMNPAGPPAALGILVGARAMKNVGGLTEGKFHAGVQALERGEAPQAVWRTWGVAKTPEGKYVYEPPLQAGESDAIRQFAQLYPDVTLNVYRRAGKREGSYDPEKREVFAQGDPNLPPAQFGSRRGVLEHELQHAADDAEGLSYGTNLDDPNYWRNAAEVRARAVEQRLDPAERKWEPSFHEDVDRMQQVIKQHPGAVAEAVKEKGGMWHPEAVERLSRSISKPFDPLERVQFRNYRDAIAGEDAAVVANSPGFQALERRAALNDWSNRAVKNYLNKYAGTKEDPLRDVEVPFGEGVKRWEEVMDDVVRPSTMPPPKGARPDETIWSFAQGQPNRDPYAGAVTSYLSHVGDYLRQNVDPAKLQQYDLVRAVKETAANDARVAKEMEKAAAAGMKDLPVYKDYSAQNPGSLPGMKWVELKQAEKLTPEQAKSVKRTSEIDEPTWNRDIRGRSSTPPDKFIPVGPDGKPITNSYTGELATGRTPEEAHLAGQLAQEGNQMGHCVGGYCEGVASGESRIYSLRDAKGKSHVTVEVRPPTDEVRIPGTDRYMGNPNTVEGKSSILQIKGKQNRAPVAEYLPYVQDFVKSGKWGEVGDYTNAGLVKYKGQYFTEAEMTKMRMEGKLRPLEETD